MLYKIKDTCTCRGYDDKHVKRKRGNTARKTSSHGGGGYVGMDVAEGPLFLSSASVLNLM